MHYRFLGGSGLKVPVLSLGTATFGGSNDYFKAWGSTDADEARRLLDICLDAGLTMFDSGDCYSGGMAEEILGKAIAGRRDKALISTKVSFRMDEAALPNNIGSSRHHLVTSCEKALRRLGTDYIDLWQLHGFDAATPVEETVRALDDLVRDGKVRYVGASNFSGWHLMKSLAVADRYGWTRHVAHQVYYSLLGRDYEWELMPLGLDQKIGAVVWSPLAMGRLTGKIARDTQREDGRAALLGDSEVSSYDREQFYLIVDVLGEIAAETGRTIPQVAVNWVMGRPTVSTVIIGARNEKQLLDTIRSIEFSLTAEQIERLDRVSARRPCYPYWHQREVFGERNPPPVADPDFAAKSPWKE